MRPKNLIAPLPYRISRGQGFGGLLSRQPCTQWTGWDHRRQQQWRERLGRGAESCSLCLREERSLQHIGTCTGVEAKRNARNERLERPYLRALNTEIPATRGARVRGEACVRRRRSARVELLFLLTLPHTSGRRAQLICWCSSLPTSNVGLNSYHFPCQA
jgi:hypothetical protein